MHMNVPERGEVLMLPNGELVVYWTVLHGTMRSIPRAEGEHGYFFQDTADLLLGEDAIKQCQCIGSLERAFAGFVKLCSLPAMPVSEDRFLIFKGDCISHVTPFRSQEEAQRWIDASWGGGGAPFYSIVPVRAVAVPQAKPWLYAKDVP